MFTLLQIIPHFIENRAILTWDFPAELRPAVFTIQRTEDPSIAPTSIGKTEDKLSFEDPEFIVTRHGQKWWYKIIAQTSGKRFDSELISWASQPSRAIYGPAAQMVLQEFRTLRAASGNAPVWIYLRKRLGPQCPDCTDPDTGQLKASSRCETCYGTGIVGGYHAPISSFALFQKEDHGHTYNQPTGKRNPRLPTVRTLAYPQLERDDLIWDTARAELFTVDAVITFAFANVIPVALDVQAFRMPQTDITQKLPVTLNPDGPVS